jgi:hypothetical protein
MLNDAFESMKKTQYKRNEQKLKLIQINNKIEELKAVSEPNKLIRKELEKTIEQKRVIEEDIGRTDCDENENPATYTTNDLTVKRAINISKITLRFLQLLCENHNPNLQNALRVQLSEDGKQKTNSFNFCSFLSKNLE